MPSGMRLRESSLLKVPGRYQEDLGPSRADRPLFVHPDVPFNPELSRHCAHPSLPLYYEGVGPSEAERARLLAAEAAAVVEADEEEDDSDEEEEEMEEEVSVGVMTDGEDSWETSSSDSGGKDQPAPHASSALPAGTPGPAATPTGPTPPAELAAPPAGSTTPAPPAALAGTTNPPPPTAESAAPVGTTTTTSLPTPSAPTTRPAHVAQIPRREPGQNPLPTRSNESGDGSGGSTVSQTPKKNEDFENEYLTNTC